MNTNRLARFLSLLFVLTLTAGAFAAEPIDLLADGKLDAWRGYKQKGVPEGWKIEDGALTRTGNSGTLITRAQFEDFDFRFEWKIAKGGNSGVMYRVQETPGPAYHTGPEYQVLDNKGRNLKATAGTAAGALYALYKPAKDATKPAGEWNTGRIVSSGGQVQHWLNGVKLVDAKIGSDDWNKRVAGSKFAAWSGFAKSKTGHIALQDHGAQVWFRGLKITKLNKKLSSHNRPVRLLFVTQSAGFKHSTVTRKPQQLSHCERVMQQLGIESGQFRVDCTQDVEKDFTPEQLENYDLVMFFTTGDLPIEKKTLDWFLGTWLKQQGHGFLGVHAAADTYHEYQPYWDMIGGTFNGHPWGSNTKVAVKVHDTDHPAMKPWGEAFTITDEIYQFKHWQPEKVRVLMSLDMQNTKLKKPYHVPVCWVKQYGEGRVMHMSLGHREDVWDNKQYQQSLLGGINWLMGNAEGSAMPNPEVSAEQEELAKQAAN